MLWSVLMGIIGGLANSLLIEDGFALPLVVVDKQNRRVWRPGFISNVLLGAIAALATFLLGAYKLELFNQLGIALVSGVGGGNVLASLMQKQQSNVLKAQMEALEEVLRNAMTPPKE
jgi:hypothetical protein